MRPVLPSRPAALADSFAPILAGTTATLAASATCSTAFVCALASAVAIASGFAASAVATSAVASSRPAKRHSARPAAASYTTARANTASLTFPSGSLTAVSISATPWPVNAGLHLQQRLHWDARLGIGWLVRRRQTGRLDQPM